MRVLVATDAFVAVGFNVPDAEFLTAADAGDAIDSSGNSARICSIRPSIRRRSRSRRMREHDRDAIADVLLNQRVLAGIGNVFKSEMLFIAGVHPFAATRRLCRRDARADRRHRGDAACASNVVSRGRGTLQPAFGRRTTGSLHPAKGLWVYGRVGEPCRVCGQP